MMHIVLYEYQKTRNASHSREFLANYSGTVVSGGYQVYHSLEKEIEELKITGCWSHARRRFANVVKTLGKEKSKGAFDYDALKKINALTKLSPEKRQNQRQLIVKPLIEAFFDWIRKHEVEVLPW